MPADKVAKLIAVLDRSNSDRSPISPKGFKEVVHTFTVETTTKLDVEEFREYFDEVLETEFASEIQKRGGEFGIRGIPFDPDYVEDETGTPTTHLAIIECVHGIKDPIIIGEPESVLIRKLQTPLNVSEWSVEMRWTPKTGQLDKV